MKEFYLPLTQHVTAGLVAAETTAVNTPGLVEASNLRPTAAGLRAAYRVNTVVGLTTAWPYPLITTSDQGVLVIDATAIYRLDGESLIPVISGLTQGYPWSIGNFFKYLLLMNGVQRVAYLPDSYGVFEWKVLSGAAYEHIPVCASIANVNGQAVACAPATWYDGASNVALWSHIGSISFIVDKLNTAGYRHLPFEGAALTVKRLGKSAVVYGEDGIVILRPVASPAATFGALEVDAGGIAGRLAVCSTPNAHYFIDPEGALWALSEDKLAHVGYNQHFAPLISGGLSLHYDRVSRDVVISGASQHYVYSTKTGTLAGPAAGGVAGIARLGSALMLFGPEAPVYTSEKAGLVTAPIDFQKRGINSLEAVEVVGSGISDLEVAVDYRYSPNEPWSRTAWHRGNTLGGAYLGISGLEFRVCVRCALTETLHISRLNVRWKAQDRRSSRGVEGVNWGVQQPGDS